MITRPAPIRFVPTEDQYAWTFGGCEPVMRIRPGDVLDLFTEDAFCGRIRSASDVASRSIRASRRDWFSRRRSAWRAKCSRHGS